ncbi:hypothetical protein INR49_008089, partial [Caranx melampygus]
MHVRPRAFAPSTNRHETESNENNPSTKKKLRRIHLRMSKQQKIHVFLGAPSPPSDPPSVSGPGLESVDRSRAGWRHLELTWTDGRLRPAVEGGGDHMSMGPGHAPSEADWTTEASQADHGPEALILRGRQCSQSATSPEKVPPPQTPPSTSSSTPDLFSPLTPSSPGPSPELFSPPCSTPRVEEGGVVLETTADGVLCSQEAEPKAASYSPAKSPDVKRTRVSEDARVDMPPHGAAAGLRGPTTLLVRCQRPGQGARSWWPWFIPVRSGPSAGTTVPLASIVVTDQSGVEMKVVLWRRAAFWVLTVSPGDILLITGLQVSEDRWRGETLLQSTFSSKLLTLGQVAASISPPVPQHVDARSLSALCEYLRERRPLLVRGSAGGAAAVGGRCGLAAPPQQRQSAGLGLPRPADRSDRRALDFIAPIHRQTGSSSTVELDLDTLLSQRHSGESQVVSVVSPGLCLQHDITVTRVLPPSQGEVELRVHVTSFHFQDAPSSQNAPQPVLDSSTPLDDVVEALSGDVTYTGCGRCGAELETDANGIYGPCYPCLPHTTVRRYYRPAVLTVSGRSNSQVCVQVPPLTLLKIFDAPPDKLHRISGSQVKHIQVAAERIQTLLSLPRKTFPVTIRSHFLCDENSVPLFQDFTLLDL